MPKKLKRVAIKEEFVVLTGDFRLAIVLQQMLYWSERVRDFDKFILEEKARLQKNNLELDNITLQNGWIWKKADELIEECMFFTLNNKGQSKAISSDTMRKYLKILVTNGWLDERDNPDPKYKFDKTKQYRVNLIKIHKDLKNLGYSLQGYKFDSIQNTETIDTTEPENFGFEEEELGFDSNILDFENRKNRTRIAENSGAIPEITTEITTEITNQHHKRQINKNNDDVDIKNKQIELLVSVLNSNLSLNREDCLEASTFIINQFGFELAYSKLDNILYINKKSKIVNLVGLWTTLCQKNSPDILEIKQNENNYFKTNDDKFNDIYVT